jgi:hypothetical protein
LGHLSPPRPCWQVGSGYVCSCLSSILIEQLPVEKGGPCLLQQRSGPLPPAVGAFGRWGSLAIPRSLRLRSIHCFLLDWSCPLLIGPAFSAQCLDVGPALPCPNSKAGRENWREYPFTIYEDLSRAVEQSALVILSASQCRVRGSRRKAGARMDPC